VVRWGVQRVFLGVESTLKPLPKTRGIHLRGVVESLHSRGIETILSVMFGLPHHNHENIQVEMDQFQELGGVFNQVTIESPIVGTPNWETFKRQGRIDGEFSVEDLHGYSTAYSHPHFDRGEILELAKELQRRIYRETGPSIMKAIEVELNGYEHCLHHPDPVLRVQKTAYLRRSLRNQAPILSVIQQRGETERTRSRAAEILGRYSSLLGGEDPHFRKKADRLLKRHDREVSRQEGSGAPTIPYPDMAAIETWYEGAGSSPISSPSSPSQSPLPVGI